MFTAPKSQVIRIKSSRHFWLPSGKRLQNTTVKITIFNEKIHYICLWPFSIANCYFTRGYLPNFAQIQMSHNTISWCLLIERPYLSEFIPIFLVVWGFHVTIPSSCSWSPSIIWSIWLVIPHENLSESPVLVGSNHSVNGLDKLQRDEQNAAIVIWLPLGVAGVGVCGWVTMPPASMKVRRPSNPWSSTV